jgi:hypothetical protein
VLRIRTTDAEPRRRHASRSDRRKNNLQPAPACSAGIARSAANRRRLSRWMPRYSAAPRVSSQSSPAALSGRASLSMTLAATRSASCDSSSSKPNPLGAVVLALPVVAGRISRGRSSAGVAISALAYACIVGTSHKVSARPRVSQAPPGSPYLFCTCRLHAVPDGTDHTRRQCVR